jgi:hypothetical protein
MEKQNRKVFILLASIFFLELIFKSSGSSLLSSMEFLIATLIIYQELKGRDLVIFIIILLLTMLLEAVNFEFVALRALLISSSYLFINLAGNFLRILKNNINVRIFLIFMINLILLQIFTNLINNRAVELNALYLIINIGVYILIYQFIYRTAPRKYAI